MRTEPVLTTIAVAMIAAVALAASILVPEDPARADGTPTQKPGPSECATPGPQPDRPWVKPHYADAQPMLDDADEIAALEAVHVALTEVGDGSTYVWHRSNGRLSGAIQPTSSFRTKAGGVCRHIVLILTSGTLSRRTEGVACRLANGRWELDG